jgi:hypothetical protein
MDTTAPRASVLLTESFAFVAGVTLSLLGALGALATCAQFVLIARHLGDGRFPVAIGFLAAFLAPATLLLLSLGWFLARRGARRLVSPARSLALQAVFVRGLGVLLFLPLLVLAAALFRHPAGNDFAVLLAFTGIACMLGAYAQLLAPPRVGPLLFGAALLLGTTVVWQYARLGLTTEFLLYCLNLSIACTISALLTAPWRRILRQN